MIVDLLSLATNLGMLWVADSATADTAKAEKAMNRLKAAIEKEREFAAAVQSQLESRLKKAEAKLTKARAELRALRRELKKERANKIDTQGN